MTDLAHPVTDYLTAEQAAVVVGVGSKRIRFACHMGALKARKLGHVWAIRPVDLAAWAHATHIRRIQQTRGQAARARKENDNALDR